MNKYHWTIQAMAEEFNLTISSFHVWRNSYQKKGAIPKPLRGKDFSFKGTNKTYYTSNYFNVLKEARSKVRKIQYKHERNIIKPNDNNNYKDIFDLMRDFSNLTLNDQRRLRSLINRQII